MRRRPERQFYFRLAGHLGSSSVEKLLEETSSRELTEWAVYEKVAGPLGGKRIDVAAAQIVAAIYNVNRKKGAPLINPSDLVPKWDDYQSDEDMWAALRSAHEAMGGTTIDAPDTPE
ncbi:phage tail assembly protein T [Allonocardiopsis opalescens]|uniref:Uncharacterized protein DUF4035 n=1 Tax=Allonocardiopsis opalescens TaxID=1144618 RepID=A0A2T0PPJ0_9ACTN|nr:DUF4035 domain-containing protein [Allonocardiopsis opalescens]PRX90820.1 uncharacterized protein DUF4035 [Allonocardiopsis opalescens]